MALSHGYRDGSTYKKSIIVIYHINKLKEKMITALKVEKAFDKIQHHFTIKVLEISGIQGTYLNIIKAIYSKLERNSKQLTKIKNNRRLSELSKSLQHSS